MYIPILQNILFSAPFLSTRLNEIATTKIRFALFFKSRVQIYTGTAATTIASPHDDNNNNTAYDRSEISCTEHLLKTVEKGSRVCGSHGKEISGEPMTNRNAMIFNHIMFAERTANRWLQTEIQCVRERERRARETHSAGQLSTVLLQKKSR